MIYSYWIFFFIFDTFQLIYSVVKLIQNAFSLKIIIKQSFLVVIIAIIDFM